MNAVAITEHYRNAQQDIELAGAGTGWLDELRGNAFENFSQMGFPGSREEAWKYTKVAAIAKHLYSPPPKACIGLDVDDIEEHLIDGLDAWRIVFVNGQYMPMLSSRRKEMPENVRIESLAKVLNEAADDVKPFLGQIAKASTNGFAALNAAFISDGAFIHVPKSVVAEKPVHILHLTTALEDELISQPRNVIVAEESSDITVIESFVSLGDSAYLTNVVTEVLVNANARVRHYKFQQESKKAYHIANLEVQQERDSRFVSHSAAFGARLSRNDINSALDGEGVECTMDGLYVLGGRQHADFHTRADHLKPHGVSNELYKGVLDGHSRGVFNGKVVVHKDAQKTDATQSNANLLISDDAEIDTKPELEIYADDVLCAHGATIGQLDENAIFYLQSRGIDKPTAKSFLTYAFAAEVIENVELDPYVKHLQKALFKALPDGASVQGLL